MAQDLPAPEAGRFAFQPIKSSKICVHPRPSVVKTNP
jgi:hypothetical protein